MIKKINDGVTIGWFFILILGLSVAILKANNAHEITEKNLPMEQINRILNDGMKGADSLYRLDSLQLQSFKK
jgi:hypothetical protein